MKTLLKQVVCALVDHPRDVILTELDGSQTVIFELRCHADDVGKVIGRNGRNINMLRCLADALGMRCRKRVILELVE